MITPIKYIVYRILPLVYDDSLSYLEVLSKVTAKTNEVIEQINSISGQIENMDDYIRETAQQIVTETVTPEYVQSIITEQYLNTWLASNAIISVLESDIATNKADITSLKTRMTDEEQATQALNAGLQNAITDFENFEDETNSELQEQQTQLNNKADIEHSHDVTTEEITGVLPWAKGGTSNTDAKTLQHKFFSALTASGASDATTLTSYPHGLVAGLYRVGVPSVTGLPSDAQGYGVLAIFLAGDYRIHLYLGAEGSLYYGRTDGGSYPATWRKLTGTSVSPRS